MSSTATSPVDGPDLLAFDAVVTLEDQLALQMRCLATPTMRAGRLRRAAVVILIAAALAPLGFAGGILAGWAENWQGPSLGSLFHALVLDQPGILIGAPLAMACLAAFNIMLRWRLMRPRLRRVLRRMLRTHPEVDPSDPQLAFRARVAVNDQGLEIRTASGMTFVRWSVLKRWEETGERFMVLGDAMAGFCVPTSAVDPATLDQFRAILTARLGPKHR